MGGSVLSPLCYGLYVCYIILSIYQWEGASRMLLGNHVGFATSSGLALPERVSGTKERRLEIEWPFTAGRQL